jgi:hypothetical protein
METIEIINDEHSFVCEHLAEPTGFEFPETRLVMEDIPSRDGSLYIGSRFGRRNLSWKGLILHPDTRDKRRNLVQACRVGQLKTILFELCPGLDVQTEIEVVKLTMPYELNRSPYLIQAVAPDYRFFSQSEISINTEITEIDGGVPVPMALPAPIPGGSSLNFSAVNNGNTSTSPTFTIRGPGSSFVVTNFTTGEQFELDLTLTNVETVVIDTYNKTAFKDSQNVFGAFEGDWIQLEPGANIITFNAIGYTANTRLTVSYRDAYLGF